MRLKKYWLISKMTLEEYFIFRLNFILWRFRSLVFFLSLFFFWLAVYGDRMELLGYQKSQMLTYVVGIAFLRGLVLAARSTDLEADIYSGRLTSFLLRPQSIPKFYFFRDLADKLLNIGFVILEISLILVLFKFPFYIPQDLGTIIWFIGLIVLAGLLFFIINIIAASLAFWTEAMWAPRWLLTIILLEFMSGAFFPLDVLPQWLAKLASFTPFPYLIYYPLKVWLNQTSVMENLRILAILVFWIGVCFYFFRKMWHSGLKNYSAFGG